MKTLNGIILHSIPFRDHDLIITLFSEEKGLIKCFAKKGKKQLLAPLMQVEIIYQEKSSELHQAKEITPIRHFLRLREDSALLEAACGMASSLLQTAPLEQPAPPLYSLFVHLLEKLHEVEDPLSILVLFRIKILVYEGLIDPTSHPLASLRSWSIIQNLSLNVREKEETNHFFLLRVNG